MIPNVLHFIRLSAPAEQGGKPWTLMHHVCLRSAIETLRPDDVRLYVDREPDGPWWTLSRPLATIVNVAAPVEIHGRPLHHVAHQTDVIRLKRLIEHGGIYLDLDVLVVRDFAPLLVNQCVLGEQSDGGLVNAVILAERQAPFLTRWLATYDTFRSKGRDAYWDEHSVRVPRRLAAEHPDEITVLDHKSFYWPDFTPTGLHTMYGSNAPLGAPDAFAHHLWESCAYDAHLDTMFIRSLRRKDTNFARLALPYLSGVHEDYGAPTRAQKRRATYHRARLRLRRLIRAVQRKR